MKLKYVTGAGNPVKKGALRFRPGAVNPPVSLPWVSYPRNRVQAERLCLILGDTLAIAEEYGEPPGICEYLKSSIAFIRASLEAQKPKK